MFFGKRILLLLVEDERFSAEMTANMLRGIRGCDLVGIAATVAEARTMILDRKPRIAIVDWQLPDGEGTELIGELAHQMPDTKWLVLSAYHCTRLIEEADSVGAQGILSKDSATADDLRRAIRALDSGRDYYCPASFELMQHVLRMPEGRHLSDRQRTILKMLADAKTRNEIAAELGISTGAVTTQIVRLADKLGFDSPPPISKIITAARASGELPQKNPPP